ncbi:LLM class flavin-dependent oxidoreductase [Microbispora cellulosiformans]|uniref:LLM class flavin-dependent oxidoreductase n=1 Tax=Microbispora cellulosiformans TaxID=2614688 RepID=A0A5J5K9L0_9ACTN|nr:LLM class flavin-dependent oxidoreductase [Microbispora cellulosiformans]KAA9381402.1 LLM class flavin-dependent oxidoreductase [Microbispora cellulosiformans]
MELMTLMPRSPWRDLRRDLDRFEDIGIHGVVVADHLFDVHGPDRRTARPGYDPLTTLAVAATLNERLELGTMMLNAAWTHPAHLIRSLNQVAVIADPRRVLAGLGAGWNPAEFAALGAPMPPFTERLARLERACLLARKLWDTGIATVPTVADDLPVAPRPATSPRLFIGGGSAGVLALAGRHADAVDLGPPTHRGRIQGPVPTRSDAVRRIQTTIDDLAESMAAVEAAAALAGRPRPQASVFVTWVQFCRSTETADVSAKLCGDLGLPGRDLTRCPYALVGDEAQVRDQLAERCERLGLDRLIVVRAELDRIAAAVNAL